MAKAKTLKVRPSVESPTWGDLQKMAEESMKHLGGNVGAANKLTGRSFYALAILASLNLDESKAAAPIFGKRHLT